MLFTRNIVEKIPEKRTSQRENHEFHANKEKSSIRFLFYFNHKMLDRRLMTLANKTIWLNVIAVTDFFYFILIITSHSFVYHIIFM